MRSDIMSLFLLLPLLTSAAADLQEKGRSVGEETSAVAANVIAAALQVDGSMDHAYWYARVLGVQLSARELACARNGTVRLAVAQGGGCAWLLEQGPCAPSEWLVLQEGAAPVCARRPCAPGYGLLAGEARCAPTHQLCAGDRLLAFRYSLRGEGRCHCKGFRALGPDGRCHVLYEQGACPDGQVMMPYVSSSWDTSMGVCMPNPCAGNFIPLRTKDVKKTRCELWPSLKCSPIFFPLFDPAIGLYVPLCDSGERGVIRPPSRPQSCIPDNTGLCTTALKFP